MSLKNMLLLKRKKAIEFNVSFLLFVWYVWDCLQTKIFFPTCNKECGCKREASVI